jgi:uncharacterized protein (TIGR00251 family)
LSQLPLKVVPAAAKTGIVGWLGESLKIKVRAPLDKGRANKEVIALLSKAINIAPSAIHIVSGNASPFKVVVVSNLSLAEKKAFANEPADQGNNISLKLIGAGFCLTRTAAYSFRELIL